MRFLCDVHIPVSFVKWLRERGHEALHVNRLPNGSRSTDEEICRYADQQGYIVVTKDSDFRDSHLLRGVPKKLIRITLGNISNAELIDVFSSYLPRFEGLLSESDGWFELDLDRGTFHPSTRHPLR